MCHIFMQFNQTFIIICTRCNRHRRRRRWSDHVFFSFFFLICLMHMYKHWHITQWTHFSNERIQPKNECFFPLLWILVTILLLLLLFWFSIFNIWHGWAHSKALIINLYVHIQVIIFITAILWCIWCAWLKYNANLRERKSERGQKKKPEMTSNSVETYLPCLGIIRYIKPTRKKAVFQYIPNAFFWFVPSRCAHFPFQFI